MKTLLRILGLGLLVNIWTKGSRRAETSPKAGHHKCSGACARPSQSPNPKQANCGKPTEAGPVTEEDKRAIMEHVQELFERGGEQAPEKPVPAGPITEEDERLIMEHIHELFEIGREQSGGKPS